MKIFSRTAIIMALLFSACSGNQKKTAQEPANNFTGAKGEVKLMTLDPGHFHAALVQKNMYDQVDSTVFVYAPDGPDVDGHLALIERYNSRVEHPTKWMEKVYLGADFMEKMLEEKPGNVMVTAGNNAKKTEYIYQTVSAGINVLADKPMVIDPAEF